MNRGQRTLYEATPASVAFRGRWTARDAFGDRPGSSVERAYVRNARRTARRHVRSWPSNESWWAVGSSRSGCRDCAGAIPATEGEPARGIYRAHRERLGRHLQVGDRRECSLRSSRRSCRNTPPTSMACAS